MAYQQTLLECLVEKGMLRCSAAPSPSAAAAAFASSSALPPPDPAQDDLQQLDVATDSGWSMQQLIRTVSIDGQEETAAQGDG